MIVKVPPKRRDGGTSFGKLISYITNRLSDGEPQNHEFSQCPTVDGACEARDAHDLSLILEESSRGRLSNVAFEHNCLSIETAAAEMDAVAAQNARSKDPVYHFILSWPADENPSDADIFASARYAIQALCMEGHQYLSAVHRDTDNVHLHVAVNRIHPETFRAVYPDRDYFTLGRAARELEMRFGWEHTPGPFAVFERDGEKVVDWASADKQTAGKTPARAAQMEVHRSEESLFSFVRGTPKVEVLKAMAHPSNFSWMTLHRTLALYRLELRPKGQGFAIYDLNDVAITPIKASDMHESLSRPRLEKRLGAYLPPSCVVDDEVMGEAVYSRHREPKRDPNIREDRRLARAKARADLRTTYTQYRNAFIYQRLNLVEWRDARSAIRLSARERRAEIRSSNIAPMVRKALYSVLAFEVARELEQLRVDTARRRHALRIDPKNQRLSYQAWIEEKAASGDAAAVSQLRAWAYRDSRAGCTPRGNDGFLTAGGQVDEMSPGLAGFEFVVEKDGAVVYTRTGVGGGFTDHGDWMLMAGKSGQDDDEALLVAALYFASAKYNRQFSITGSEKFIKKSIELLVKHKIYVTLKDPVQSERFHNIIKNKPEKPC